MSADPRAAAAVLEALALIPDGHPANEPLCEALEALANQSAPPEPAGGPR